MAESFFGDFKRFFLRGLAAVLPALLTVAIIIYVVTFLNAYLVTHVTDGAEWLLERAWPNVAEWFHLGPPPWEANPKIWDTYFPWVGFILSLLAIYIFGRFVASFLGRIVWRRIEKAFFRLPVIKQIYPYIKQVTDFLLSEKKMDFSRVVAVEYPRRGIWSLGLVTGPGMRSLSSTVRDDSLLTVFIPSSPTPVTGYIVTVRRDEVVDMPLSIDDAVRFAISCGVIIPPSQLLSDAEVAQARHGKRLPTEKSKEVVT